MAYLATYHLWIWTLEALKNLLIRRHASLPLPPEGPRWVQLSMDGPNTSLKEFRASCPQNARPRLRDGKGFFFFFFFFFYVVEVMWPVMQSRP